MSAGFVTAADLQHQLGGIPLERIRVVPPPGLATEEDALRIQGREGLTCEVIDGVLVEKAMGFNESCIAATLIQLLKNFVDKHDLGIVAGPDGLIRLTQGRTRAPDVAFFSWSKFPQRRLPEDAVPSLCPDLAVEILSASNTESEIEGKLDEYFSSGATVAWVIDPAQATAQVYAGPNQFTDLTADDLLSAPSILPGFQVALSDLLNRAGRRE
jgi:Uma2 family endonuclease